MKKIKHELLKWASSFDFIQKLCIALIFNRIVHETDRLIPEHLTEKGWIKDGYFYVEQNIKGRDKIWIQFESHYYRVYHGENRTFIALERSKKWFEIYYLMAHGDNGRFNLAVV